MPPLFFPFRWGSPSVDTVIIPPAAPPFWVKDTPGVVAWHVEGASLLPRFEHVYPQEAGGEQQFVKLPPPD